MKNFQLCSNCFYRVVTPSIQRSKIPIQKFFVSISWYSKGNEIFQFEFPGLTTFLLSTQKIYQTVRDDLDLNKIELNAYRLQNLHIFSLFGSKINATRFFLREKPVSCNIILNFAIKFTRRSTIPFYCLNRVWREKRFTIFVGN